MGGEVPEGDHMISVEVSLDGQQFSSQGVKFLYKSVTKLVIRCAPMKSKRSLVKV